jgi:hypothetical protein
VIPSPAQTLLLLVAIVVAFLAGLAVGALNDPTETLTPVTVTIPTPAGNYKDVPLTMRGTNDNTWRYICDMQLSPTSSTAQCEYQP